jgi:hypothetical protein
VGRTRDRAFDEALGAHGAAISEPGAASVVAVEFVVADRSFTADNDDEKLTWVLRRALAREGREATRDRLRALLDRRG